MLLGCAWGEVVPSEVGVRGGHRPKAHACLEGPILEAHIGTLHSPAVSHLLSDTTFPQLGILRVPLFVPVLAGFLLRTTQVRSAPVSNWQPLSHRRYHVRHGVPPARSRSDEIDGNLVVMSGAGAVRPHSLVWLALDTAAGTMDTCGVSWWQSGSESLLTSLLGTSRPGACLSTRPCSV